jgi:hypothetical protein
MSYRFLFKGFFYLQKFDTYVNRGKQKGLVRTANYIRGACIRTLRVSKTVAPPNTPPHAKTRGGLRVIHAAVYRNGAIIGPIKFASSNYFNSPVPHIHEFGGTYLSRFGYWRYPQRSFMYHTLKQLIARKAIPKQFSAGLARQFNS